MADRDGAVTQGREIKRPTMLRREAAHVRNGGVHEVIDEPDRARETQHALRETVALLARHTRGIAQGDQRMQQPDNGRPRQAGLPGQHTERRRPAATERLQHREAAADRLDDSVGPHRKFLVRNTDFVDLACARRSGRRSFGLHGSELGRKPR